LIGGSLFVIRFPSAHKRDAQYSYYCDEYHETIETMACVNVYAKQERELSKRCDPSNNYQRLDEGTLGNDPVISSSASNIRRGCRQSGGSWEKEAKSNLAIQKRNNLSSGKRWLAPVSATSSQSEQLYGP
jgi:hypothetical protein